MNKPDWTSAILVDPDAVQRMMDAEVVRAMKEKIDDADRAIEDEVLNGKPDHYAVWVNGELVGKVKKLSDVRIPGPLVPLGGL